MEIDRSTQSVLSYGRLIGEFADRWAQIMNFAKGRYLDKTITISKIQLGSIRLAQNSPLRPLVFHIQYRAGAPRTHRMMSNTEFIFTPPFKSLKTLDPASNQQILKKYFIKNFFITQKLYIFLKNVIRYH